MIQLTEEQQEQLAKKIAALFVVDINDLEPYTELVRNKIAESLPLLDSDSQTAEPDYRQLARELAMIVDVGTNDDPGTALAKLRKIQHVAATRMRDNCVEKVRAMRDEWRRQANSREEFQFANDRLKRSAQANAADWIITAIESLTLDPLEPKK